VVEWKSSASGSMQYDAQNRAARSGTALIYAIEQLWGHPTIRLDANPFQGDNTVISPSTRLKQPSSPSHLILTELIYGYTGTWSRTLPVSSLITLSLVKKYWLDEASDVWTLRRTIDNILDWG
jgi:hypothetical protein